ncbi:Pre-mRNA-splicing factor cwf16 [Friedmanniomyces endolithicus]|nr:Pre-mRNA-splicing factor cwf16 [Friedmanniomyces endolithicus]KAK0816366.1 Pre-mRNA-splicing factor cwf16 [Friedmanniomyces endolithicus]KAK0857952.1 Pre-mRNA-splicing factor cwf16 [Friedmanniomyces endolithicus]KAK1006666.1 Pre-mRNA-splicing factor cwf16 [Friedmanniomyces endolithicus]KAK1032022.1 Pre-mRNA-splicing factor cwf16 [Friedmanniomyces endolithicus]
MSERKVLQKYYPPDFDPAKIERRKGPKPTGLKVQVVRLMAPFSMKCIACGEYIYKGRKFNARKETTDEKYYAITIYRFYIRCTRCSAEITFKTDPKHMDYECERGAKRNFEVWRERVLGEETDEERLDRLEREESERDKMVELERKTDDARTEMAVADALDERRMVNARRERADVDGTAVVGVREVEGGGERERERVEREIEEEARRAFMSATRERVRRLDLDAAIELVGPEEEDVGGVDSARRLSEDTAAMPPPPLPMFLRKVKEKKAPSLLMGIKKKAPVLVTYGDDDDDD